MKAEHLSIGCAPSFPCFWHTVGPGAVPDCCAWDLDTEVDWDVDGLDLVVFVDMAFDAIDLLDFASEFGRDDCPE